MKPSSLDVTGFVEELLEALTKIEGIQSVSVHAEGPTVKGQAFLSKEKFLAFYYNQMTGTQAFALVDKNKRIWGIDYDNMRGWHIHSVEAPERHQRIEKQTITQIIEKFGWIVQ